jgi:hypothetical protein
MKLNTNNIYWIILIVAILHVIDEYLMGFVDWSNTYAIHINIKQFIVINILFWVLCFVAAIHNKKYPQITFSIVVLIFINAFLHIGGSIKSQTFMPGLLTALFLYIPISIYTFILYNKNNILKPKEFVTPVVIGFLLMAFPFFYQLLSKLI